MGLVAKKPRATIQEYYRIENDAAEKHEFREGEIVAMHKWAMRCEMMKRLIHD